MGHDGQTGPAVWQGFYGSWLGAKGLGDKLQPVVVGASNMMGSIGIPQTLGFAIMGVFISSFAGTTLDTAVRIQRYVVGELTEDMHCPMLSNRWTATTIAVITAAALAFVDTHDGKITFGASGTGSVDVVAAVRHGQSASGRAGAAGGNDVSEKERRAEIPCRRNSVRHHAGRDRLGHGAQ